ncbi:MAG: RNA polymerase sigma factor [Eubacterium sp.]
MILMTMPAGPIENSKFIQLYQLYKNLAMYVVQKRIGDKHISEDCVQETFLYIANNFEKIGDVNSVHTKNYVATVANGIAISHYRRRAKEKIVSIYDEKYSSAIDESCFDDYEAVDLSFAIDKLSDEEKNIIYLKYTFGLTSKEIGQIYKISDSSVRKKLQFAMQKLRAVMKGDCNE